MKQSPNTWRTVAILLLGATLLVTAWSTSKRDEATAAPAPPVLPNGDTNSDGLRDIADAIFLLQWLFVGGPEPAPIECPGAGSPYGALPASGQTRCYDASGAEIDCGDEERPGQDPLHGGGCSLEARWESAGRGVVLDTCTGLEWQQVSLDAPALQWEEALRYAGELILTTDGRGRRIRERPPTTAESDTTIGDCRASRARGTHRLRSSRSCGR